MRCSSLLRLLLLLLVGVGVSVLCIPRIVAVYVDWEAERIWQQQYYALQFECKFSVLYKHEICMCNINSYYVIYKFSITFIVGPKFGRKCEQVNMSHIHVYSRCTIHAYANANVR